MTLFSHSSLHGSWSTLQILSLFSVLLAFHMPSILSEFYGALDVSQLNPLSAFAVSCASGSLARFLPKLLFMTLAPMALGSVIMTRCVLQVHVWKLERAQCHKQALRLFLLMCYFVLPATSTTIFRTFLCGLVRDLKPCLHRALIVVAPCVLLPSHRRCDSDFGTSPREEWLIADYSVSCLSARYRRFFFPWAVLMSFVYPVGIPLMYTCLVLPHRKALEQDRAAALASMGSSILVQEYKSRYWFFEAIDSIRRVALSGFLVFWGERARVGVAFCIALGFQLLFLEAKPFVRRESNLLASLANFEISAVLLLLLNTQARSIKGGAVAGSLCIFVNLLLVPPLLMIQVYRTYQRRCVIKLLDTKEREDQGDVFFSQSNAIVDMLSAGQKSRMLLLHKTFDWLSRWTLEFPITDRKWAQRTPARR